MPALPPLLPLVPPPPVLPPLVLPLAEVMPAAFAEPPPPLALPAVAVPPLPLDPEGEGAGLSSELQATTSMTPSTDERREATSMIFRVACDLLAGHRARGNRRR
jgi:hypothetical protein